MSRDELEKEITRLRSTVEQMKSDESYSQLHSFLPQAMFFKRAQEEILRSQRYEKEMTFIAIEFIDYDRIRENMGEEAALHYIRCLQKLCSNSCRNGVDILGRIKTSQFGIILPESDLSGCNQFKERMKDNLSRAEITWNDTAVKSSIKISAGVLLEGDKSFGDLYQRTLSQQRPALQKSA